MEGNGWSSYEKLVLKAIDDLASSQKDTNKQLGELTTNVALLTQTVEKSSDLEERVSVLEANAVTGEEVKKERRWMYGAALAIISSIIFPSLIVLASTGTL